LKLRHRLGHSSFNHSFGIRHSDFVIVSIRVYSCSFVVKFFMDPYAKPKERKVGAQRPNITHLPKSMEKRTRRERQAEKEGVAAERRAIKKAARRHLKQQLLEELARAELKNRDHRFGCSNRALRFVSSYYSLASCVCSLCRYLLPHCS
jgi:hypothetical protein